MDLYRMWRKGYNFELSIQMPIMSIENPDNDSSVQRLKHGVSAAVHRVLQRPSEHPFFQIDWMDQNGHILSAAAIKQTTGKDVEVVNFDWRELEAEIDAVRNMAITDNEKLMASEKIIDDVVAKIMEVKQRGSLPVMPHP